MASEEFQIFTQHDLPNCAFPVMEEIRRKGKFCDVVIKVDDSCFSAHRIVLSATIPYFHAMFTHDMVESQLHEIQIDGIDPFAMEALINFAYSGKISIHTNNVQGLMLGASYLQLGNVRDACAEFLRLRIQPSNVLSLRSFGDTLSCGALTEAADTFLEKKFTEVAQEEEFLSLDVSQVQEILSRDKLHVDSEDAVFEAVIRWVKRDSQTRAPHLPLLLTRVRMPLLSPEFLADRVATEALVRSSHKCRDLLDEAKDYHLLPERRPLLQSFQARPRCCSEVVGLIYAVGGLTNHGDSLSTVEVLDPLLRQWKSAEAMSMLRSRVGVAVMRNKLYAIGGYNGTERLATVEVFDVKLKVWTRAAPMNFKRSAVGAAALNDQHLYVIGGYDGVTSLNTVEKYDAMRDSWSLVGSMLKHRSAAGVVAFEDCIYALGGHDGLSIFDSVEKYDPHTGQWSMFTPMQSKRCRLGVAVLGGKIYVCGGYDGATFLRSVEVLDPVTKKWGYVCPMNVARSRVALAANMGKLYAIGGYDGVSNLSTVEVYDPETNSWSFGPSMIAHSGGVGVGVIPI